MNVVYLAGEIFNRKFHSRPTVNLAHAVVYNTTAMGGDMCVSVTSKFVSEARGFCWPARGRACILRLITDCTSPQCSPSLTSRPMSGH